MHTRAQPLVPLHCALTVTPAMALSVLTVHRRRPKYAAALLSPSCLQKLVVPDEFAARLGGDEEEEEEEEEGTRGRAVAVLLVSPLGKVWRAELRRASGGGGGWQLGGGWAEFAAANGVGARWSVVFRVERRGVATVRAFDAGGRLARLCKPYAGVAAGKNRPRFIRLLRPDDLEKMRIPDKFLQEHLTESCTTIKDAMIVSPLGKFWRVELARDQPGVLLGDGWALFLTAHDLSEGNILVFRYEGNMVFSVEVFLQNGCLKEYGAAAANMIGDANGLSTEPQQGVKQLGGSPGKKKRKSRNEITCMEVATKTETVSPISAKKVVPQKKLVSKVPRHSFTKQITRNDLKAFLVSTSFLTL
ncbi:hypothetical protein ACP70R_044162 [Stipagrostis hirtigluma subsp. patula]